MMRWLPSNFRRAIAAGVIATLAVEIVSGIASWSSAIFIGPFVAANDPWGFLMSVVFRVLVFAGLFVAMSRYLPGRSAAAKGVSLALLLWIMSTAVMASTMLQSVNAAGALRGMILAVVYGLIFGAISRLLSPETWTDRPIR